MTYREDGYRPLRIVKELYGLGSAQPEAVPTLTARMFGHFECALDGKAVKWLRRMDRRLFRHLLLTKSGSETKEEILERFWPGQDATSAMQTLRTTCSNIKKAIANLVGTDRVAHYFSSSERIAVNLDNITVDVRRFITHMRTGNTNYAVEAWEQALYHYRKAEALYTAHLGWGDEEEPLLQALADECRAMRMTAASNTLEILSRLGRHLEAREHERIVNEHSNRHRVQTA
jgi:two-component SAPR family response regulator